MTRHNPLRELHRFGVSVWYDYISRSLIASGELARLIAEDGVRGVTSNPAIFEKAIGGSADYDAAIRRLARPRQTPQELFEALAVEDIREACDILAPLHAESKGGDGFVSLELPPHMARDARGSGVEAVRLAALVARPNLMVKIPGTVEGLAAFEHATAEGVSVNVTLLFSKDRYAAVLESYLKGLERRAAAGHDLARVASVASFFVSRVDTAIDAILVKRTEPEAKALLGKAAIANAKLAYQHYKHVMGSPRWRALAAKGAKPQRLLWASTGTKNPAYKDTLYCEELIGLDTVNTMPPATVDAFRSHGMCRPSLEEDVAEAAKSWDALPRFGVDRDAVLARLEQEGLDAFSKSFETLMGKLAAKRALLEAENAAVEEGIVELEKARFAERLWAKDASTWTADKDGQKLIKRSLGWLDAPLSIAAGLAPVRAFADEARAEGFKRAVVLGMGGSSLCVEVLRAVCGAAPGRLELSVLDSTHPDAVAALTASLDLERTLFIVASKSGSTIEPNCLFDHFWHAVSRQGGQPGRRFAAVTDPGTSLEKLARELGFRKVFLNPPDVGGRFSALTLFGLVPAALAGIEAGALLERARAMSRACSPQTPTRENPGLRLGAALGRHARAGRDKLTLVLPPAWESFGLWVEQLVAESTGKDGNGVVPVVGEVLEAPSRYGRDRLFVRLALKGREEPETEKRLAALEEAGHPVVRLEAADALDLGAQFFLWEAATAAAGFLLGVNPFDQPDVQSAKEKTAAILSRLEGGQLPPEKASMRAGGLAAFSDGALASALKADAGSDKPLRDVLAAHLTRLAPGDYVAVLAFLAESDENRRLLEDLRARLSAKAGTAPVILSYGPRYLHSTGQLHKGGAPRGVFLVLSEPERARVPVPTKPFSFATLCRAQARGDFEALQAAGRRVLRLELGPSGPDSLRALANALGERAGTPA